MSERLTDEQLQDIAGWYDKTQTAASSMADELLALRARVAKLEAALLNCKKAAEDYNDGSIPHFVETALKDNPQ